MKVIAAFLLAVLGGNENPNSDDIKTLLASVGAEAEDEMINLLLSQIEGKDITELLASGREKLASVSSGGGVAVAVAPASSGGDAAPAPEAKKEEKVEEEDDEEDFGMNLFD